MTGPGGQLRARADLDQRLAQLHADVATLAERVDVAIARAIDALARLDRELAETVIAEDERVNELRFAIEDRVTEITATP